MEKLYKTGDVLKRAGISREVFYRYLTMELIRPAATTAGGHNRFSENVFTRLDLIRRLRESGYSLRDIKDTYFKDERLDSSEKAS